MIAWPFFYKGMKDKIMKEQNATNQDSQAGNVLFYIFLCVALLGVLTMAMTGGGKEQAAATSAFRMSEDIKVQAQGIRSVVLECILVQNASYPAQPGTQLLSDVQCDMASGGPQNLFTAQSARAAPIPPTPFDPWRYNNDGAGFISAVLTSPRASSPTVRNIMTGLAEAFNAPQTSPTSNVYQNQEVCIIDTGSVAEFHICLKSSTGVCGKLAPANQNASGSPCSP
jgi:hypothetical protein